MNYPFKCYALSCIMGITMCLTATAAIEKNISLTATLGVPFYINPAAQMGISQLYWSNLQNEDGVTRHYYLSNSNNAYTDDFYIEEKTHTCTVWGGRSETYYSFNITPLVLKPNENVYTFRCKFTRNNSNDTYIVTYRITVIDITSISIPSSLSLFRGDAYSFSPIIAQPGATTTLTWQSSNTSVATIDQNGNMSATGIGKTIIMCTAHNGVSASCEVTVNPIMVSSIALNQTEAEMCVGDKLQLSATVLPVNATTPAVAWTSSDESVAIVDENGQVTALKSGDVRITATATDGSGKSANCSVQVARDNKLTANNITMCQAGKGTMHILLTQEDDISGFQFDLTLPEGITVAENAGGQLLAALTNRASSHSISADKVSEGLYRFIVVSLSGKAITQGEGDVMTITLQADNDIAVGEYNVTMKEIELTVKNGITYSQVYPRDNTARLTVTDLMPGDVNGDGKVSVTDVISIISYILEEEPVQFIKSAADLNSDDKVSVTDAIGVIDIILNNK